VILGVDTQGRKHLLACESGYRESKESWSAILRDMKSRGLKLGRVTVADGHLGIWAALSEMHPTGEEQRCWNHKIVNVLDRFPKRLQSEAKEFLYHPQLNLSG
jgi:transposase-like protein